MIDLFANLTSNAFAAGFRDANEPRLALGQDNDQQFRLYLLRSGRHPGSGHPFIYDVQSGATNVLAIASLRDITASPVTLASSPPMTPVRDGFEGILHTNTPEIASFLAGRAERKAGFCIDLTDVSGFKTSPFRSELILRATDAGAPTIIAGELYLSQITGFIGGGPTNLDGVNTAARSLGTLFRVIVNIGITPVLSEWRLQEGPDATDLAAGIIRPLDHDPVTNPRILVLVSGTAV